MRYLVYSPEDMVSAGAAAALRSAYAFRPVSAVEGISRYEWEGIELLELPGHHLYADYLDKLGADLIIVLTRHSSAKSVPAFTAHPVGNWTDDAKLGGRPRELSTAAPVAMLKILKALSERAPLDIPVTYEATHHGPALRTPVVYAEVGGNEEIWKDGRLHKVLAEAVVASLDAEASFGKVALGIGGLHYESKFSRLALEGRFAFGHMMSKHYCGELAMLAQAIERSDPRPEVAVIEWKSLASEERSRVIARLSELGLDYERV